MGGNEAKVIKSTLKNAVLNILYYCGKRYQRFINVFYEPLLE